MIENRASRTAQGAAMHRGAHQICDRPLVFVDPLAVPILGEAGVELTAGRSRYCEPRMAGLRALIVVRSRLTEDTLGESGAGQYVLLGAGLDTFAYRHPGFAVFEVDHPATQAWKRERLLEAGIAVPESARFVPVDFERESFVDGLKRSGFDFTKPAVVAWLGVVPYLEKHTVFATLRTFADSMAPGSQILFDYPSPREELTDEERRTAIAFALRVAAAGEPLRSFLGPQELSNELGSLHLHGEDFNHATLAARYLAGRSDRLALNRHAHIMRARIEA
jgi:methyltransferase (TIGR00027 family)